MSPKGSEPLEDEFISPASFEKAKRYRIARKDAKKSGRKEDKEK
jgi:hypothetical protein